MFLTLAVNTVPFFTWIKYVFLPRSQILSCCELTPLQRRKHPRHHRCLDPHDPAPLRPRSKEYLLVRNEQQVRLRPRW
jgi:hypothetical protein